MGSLGETTPNHLSSIAMVVLPLCFQCSILIFEIVMFLSFAFLWTFEIDIELVSL